MVAEVTTPSKDARERILAASYDLFVERGIRAVGVNEIIATAEVAKATFYSHFPSKDDLVMAFFERRQQLFTTGYLTAESQRRADTPREQLLAIFDIFDEWFHAPGFTGCPYIRALLETGPLHPVGAASLVYLNEIRSSLEAAATAMGLTDPDDFAYCWLVLMQGAIISGVGIDPDSGTRIRKLGDMLITLHTPAEPQDSTGSSDAGIRTRQAADIPSGHQPPRETAPATIAGSGAGPGSGTPELVRSPTPGGDVDR